MLYWENTCSSTCIWLVIKLSSLCCPFYNGTSWWILDQFHDVTWSPYKFMYMYIELNVVGPHWSSQSLSIYVSIHVHVGTCMWFCSPRHNIALSANATFYAALVDILYNFLPSNKMWNTHFCSYMYNKKSMCHCSFTISNQLCFLPSSWFITHVHLKKTSGSLTNRL